MDRVPDYPLYGFTYSLYRLSPLYNRKTPLLHRATLNMHARRMRELLKGDSLRGVQVGAMLDTGVASLGPLEDCTWDMIGDEDAWIAAHSSEGVDETADDLSQIDNREISPEVARGLLIRFKYATTTYTALLMRDPKNTTSPQHFTYLPLLLLRMPGPLRSVVVDHLSSAFDTRIAPMRLRPAFLMSTLEKFLGYLTAPDSNQSVPDTVKQLQIQISFPATTDAAEKTSAALLKHIDVNIEKDDVYEFFTRGKLLLSQPAAVYPEIDRQSPFTAALVHYLVNHLALEPAYIQSGISRITSGLFTLSAEGKMKLFVPPAFHSDNPDVIPETSASELFMQEFYGSLIREATMSISKETG
jgi:hypothetical protein